MSLAEQLAKKFQGTLPQDENPSWSFDGVCSKCGNNTSECTCTQNEILPPSKHHLYFKREKRKGKIVTLVGEFFCEDATIKDVVAKLKKTLGCGGSYKEGFIEVQGEHEEKIYHCLENFGYKFKHKK